MGEPYSTTWGTLVALCLNEAPILLWMTPSSRSCNKRYKPFCVFVCARVCVSVHACMPGLRTDDLITWSAPRLLHNHSLFMGYKRKKEGGEGTREQYNEEVCVSKGKAI